MPTALTLADIWRAPFRQQFNGDEAVQTAIAGLVDLAHAALADLLHEGEVP
ncbi:MAG: hypothetical protein ACR2NN_12755 [Bryobacteraceae bacterium]